MNQIISKIPHNLLVLAGGAAEVISKLFICPDNSPKNILSGLKIQAVILLIINVNIFKNTSLNQSFIRKCHNKICNLYISMSFKK